MNSFDRTKRGPLTSVDWPIILTYFLMLAFGWLSVCGASHEIGDTNFFAWSSFSGKQIVWMGCATALAFVLLMLEERYYDMFATIIYVGMMVLLLITPFLSSGVKGSYSWIKLGAVSLQPAEFAKCATALFLAKVVGQHGFSLTTKRNFTIAVAIVLLPMVLIILQRETGSALVYLAFFLVFYREGMAGSILFTAFAAVVYFVIGIRFAADPFPGSYSSIGESVVTMLIWCFTFGLWRVYCRYDRFIARYFWAGLALLVVASLFSAFIFTFDVAWLAVGLCVAIALFFAWRGLSDRLNSYLLIAAFTLGSLTFFYASDYVLNNVMEPHQRVRINVLLGIEENNSGAGYNVNQSKIAIGSGGILGKGFMNGTQTKLKYVPEQHTDFIFCTVGEEQGFVGSAACLFLFLFLILRLIYLSERQSSTFGRVYGYCVASVFLFHVFINIGMVMGLTPVIGIPLPFFSYGGSSLWGFTLLLFIFLRIDANSKNRLRQF